MPALGSWRQEDGNESNLAYVVSSRAATAVQTLLNQNGLNNRGKERRKGRKKTYSLEVRGSYTQTQGAWGEMKMRKFPFSNLHIIQFFQEAMCAFLLCMRVHAHVCTCTCVRVRFALMQACRGKELELLLRSCREMEFLSPTSPFPGPSSPRGVQLCERCNVTLQQSCAGQIRLEHNVLNFS